MNRVEIYDDKMVIYYSVPSDRIQPLFELAKQLGFDMCRGRYLNESPDISFVCFAKKKDEYDPKVELTQEAQKMGLYE